MRSLAAHEGFKGAKESLNVMFYDVAKKVKNMHDKHEETMRDKIAQERQTCKMFYCV